MKTAVEELGENQVKVTVTIDEDTVSNLIKNQYKQAANQYNIPGFRRGKAPRPVIDNALGKEFVRASVTDELVNSSYPEAIGESGIFPVGQPEFGEGELELVEDGKPYSYEFKISTMPTMELSDYGPITIEMPSEEVSEETVDAEIDSIREHYYEIANAPANTKVKEDSYVDMKIGALDDKGVAIESIASDSMQYGLGSGLFPPEFDEQLIGLKKGDSKEFTIEVPVESYAMTDALAGRTATAKFNIEILAVQKKKLPELTDEWVKEKLGMDTVDELKDEIRDEISQQLSSALPRIKEARALAALEERLVGDVPENVIEDEENSLLQDFFSQLQRAGLTLDGYLQQQGITPDRFREDIKLQATDVAKQNMALDAYAAGKGLVATDEDILAEFKKVSEDEAESLMDEWAKSGRMYLIRQGILREKAADEIMETAEVVVAEPEKGDKPKKGKKAKADDDAKQEEAADAE